MTCSDLIQVILMGLLVVVTAVYVWRTFAISNAAKEQADASVNMAEEMRKQRYDTVRPVIDIEMEESPNAHVSIGLTAMFGNTSRGLSCILHNIGLGPAIDVRSFVQPPTGNRWCKNFGTLAIGRMTEPINLSPNQEDDRTVLVAYYKDVYGRTFELSREVRADKEKGLQLDPPQIRLIEEKESHD